MSKAEFTKGPWVREDDQFFAVIKTQSGDSIAQVANFEDSHIIAAAPELYEVLFDLCVSLEMEGIDGCHQGYMDKAGEALAKARGELCD